MTTAHSPPKKPQTRLQTQAMNTDIRTYLTEGRQTPPNQADAEGFTLVENHRQRKNSNTSATSSSDPRPPQTYTALIQKLPPKYSNQKDFYSIFKATSVVVFRNGTAQIKSLDPKLNKKLQRMAPVIGAPITTNPTARTNYPSVPKPTQTRQPTFSCVAKGVDTNITPEEIRACLEEADLDYKTFWRIRSRATDRETTLIRILTESKPTLDYLLNSGIKMFGRLYQCEPSHPSRPQHAQCTNYQTFGHLAEACVQQVACVRCGKTGHSVRTCTTSADAPAVCSNCKGTHPAYAFNCPARPKELPTLEQYAPLTCVDEPAPTTDEEPTCRVTDMIRFTTTALLNLFPENRTKINEIVSRLSKQFFQKPTHISYTGNKIYIGFRE